MQENYKITVGISSKPEVLNPQCSCTECESITCFAKRQTTGPCECKVCRNTKSCLFYNANINLKESKSGSINFKDIEKELADENKTREVIKKEIIYELDSNNHMKIISKKKSTFSYKTVDSKDKIEVRNDKPLSAAVTNSLKEKIPSTGKLSAQIMDMPYKDFQKSLTKPHFPPNLSNISPYDIFNRIKEAYKACSCKVCECIVGKSLQNDLCRCKPCECDDCASFSRQVKSFTDCERLVPKDDEGCPCIRCERGSCKGIGKNRQECDCVGVLQCSYLKSDSYSRDCNCEPCQCIECESRSIHRHRALIVAPVAEDYSRRNACQCSPCECFECGHGLRPSNQHNEMSTSMNRHPHCHCEMCVNETCILDSSQSCRCDRHSKVMSKPFQQDSHDYDIRRTTVTYNDAQRRKEINNHDTIAMFAAITNSYPKREKIVKQCDCDQCECLVCKYKKSMANNGSSKVFEPIQNYELKNKAHDCKCSPCECQYCANHDTETHNTNNSNVCECDVCDCIICDGLASSNIKTEKHETKKMKSKFSAKGDCRCIPCECAECEKLMSSCIGDICLCSSCRCENCVKPTHSDEVIYPVKRGERLTPSVFRRKIKDAFIESCISTLEANEKILKHPIAFKSPLKKPSVLSSFQKIKNKDDCNTGAHEKCFKEGFSNQHNMAPHHFTRTETIKHALISKCANGINLHGKNTEAALESNLSTYSSMSFLKDSGSFTPSRCRLKSWESSCNSSGHDYPSYLIHFPKTTVETCLNDVMQFDNDNSNNINLTPTNALNSKNNVRKQHNREFNVQKLPKISLPMTTVISQENLTEIMNDLSQTREDNFFKYSTQNFEDNPYKPQNFETKSLDVSKPKEKHKNYFMRDYYPRPYEEHSYACNKSNKNSFVLDEDYERVQHTLQEARAFSLQLVQLLEKYEKANREFESVSEKIKMTNISLSNKTNILKHPNTGDLIYTFDTDQVPTKEKQQSSSGSSTEELVAINKNANKIEDVHLQQSHAHISEDQVDAISENIPMNDNNEGRDESGDNINKINEVLNTITEEREPIDISHKQDKKRRVVTKLHRRFSKMYKRSIICSRRIKSSTNSSSVEVDATTVTVETNNTPLENKRPIKIIENKNDDDRNNINKDFKAVFIDVKLPKLAEHVNTLKVKKSNKELRYSVTEKFSKDHHVLQKEVVMIKQPLVEHSRQIIEMKEEEPWPIMKKNFCLGTNTNAHGGKLPFLTPLENDVKATAQMISNQPDSENATYLYENKALIKLHSEVKKLLEMPVLQTFESNISGQRVKDISFNNLSKASSSQTNQGSEDCRNHNAQKATITAASSRNSCETMKVNFLNVRRVSDHTVLVKWNAPRVLNNVEGYELLVDGRAVQKILSPSRRMAVVTCLPHNDRVLLTVRTILSSPCPDHYPAATVIYQPKTK